MDEEKIIEERKGRLIKFAKEKYEWLSYIGLAIIVWIAVFIRTRNLPLLRDITTGQWTLGPDLDPFLFLRWAKYIVAHGKLMAIDLMRYVPLGFNTKNEVLLHPYLIAWFHKFASAFGFSGSVEQSAAIYPVFVFALTVIAFFLLVREIFKESQGKKNANIIALISSLFLSILPPILLRTIAGIPEKEASGFFFLFLAFYLFIKAWKAKSLKIEIPFAILAGLASAGMAFVWGGYIYIPLTIAFVSLIAFFLGQINKNKIYVLGAWILVFYLTCGTLSSRYSLSALLNSTTTIIPLAVFGIIIIDFIIFNTKLRRYFEGPKLSKIPRQAISLGIAIILGTVIASLVFGPGYIMNKVGDVTHVLITPTTDRISITVAENSQPYFGGWADSFGPMIKGIPIFFWLFFIGSIYLFSHMLSVFNKKEKIYLTVSYAIFLFAIIFSRYSSDSLFNGTNLISTLFYLAGVICLIGTFGYYYYKTHERNEQEKLKEIDSGFIMIFSLFFLSIISARGAVRLVMVLVPSASIMVAYFIVALCNDIKHKSKDGMKLWAWILIGIVIVAALFSAYSFYQSSYGTAKSYAPTSYTQQWQKAMAWVRTNTPENSVFGHWWDYGYWVQSIGERATVLDGGNSIPYWDYLMGRTITTPDESFALDFLYAHNTTHFLIDSSDIGKYAAFSSIGSDINYDRASYISTFAKDAKQTIEQKNSSLMVYTGGFGLDGDITYIMNGTKIFLPQGKAGLGAIIVEIDNNNEVKQPIGVFVYQNQQYRIPLRYAYYNGLKDFNSGLEAGIFIYPLVNQNSIDKTGALLYLSGKVVNSLFAKLYLYNENDQYFKLAHNEDDFVVASLKSQGALSANEDFVYYQGLRGPIRIWEIHYPAGMQVKQEFSSTDYSNANLTIAK